MEQTPGAQMKNPDLSVPASLATFLPPTVSTVKTSTNALKTLMIAATTKFAQTSPEDSRAHAKMVTQSQQQEMIHVSIRMSAFHVILILEISSIVLARIPPLVSTPVIICSQNRLINFSRWRPRVLVSTWMVDVRRRMRRRR